MPGIGRQYPLVAQRFHPLSDRCAREQQMACLRDLNNAGYGRESTREILDALWWLAVDVEFLASPVRRAEAVGF